MTEIFHDASVDGYIHYETATTENAAYQSGCPRGRAWYEISQSIAHVVMDCTGYVVDVIVVPRRRLDQPELFSFVDAEEIAKELVAVLK